MNSLARRRFVRTLGGATFATACSPALAADTYRLPRSVREARWTDSQDRPRTLADLAGQPTMITMSYAACRRTCSTSMFVLGEIQKMLDAEHRQASFVVVTYDPAADSPQAWRDYRRGRGLTRENWHFLTGAPADTRALARYLDLDFWTYHEHVVHDFRLVLFDGDLRFLAQIDWNARHGAAAAVRDALSST